MFIIIGLGNPGRRYENTRHNIGFITVDQLAEKHGIRINKIKHKALVGEGIISGHKVLLVKPQTYMNLSGQSVREVVAYYKPKLSNLIVVYDDVDLPMGRIRIRPSGSAGTHNGMRSIIYDIQRDDFPRVRIGIGGERKMRLADYVTVNVSSPNTPGLRALQGRAALDDLSPPIHGPLTTRASADATTRRRPTRARPA